MEIWFFAAKANSKVFLIALIPIYLYLKTSITIKRETKMKKLIKIFKILFFTLAFIGAILFIRVVGLLSRG